MAYEDRHDNVFIDRFKNNVEGHALYLAVSSASLKPGACGYFDTDGNWQTIVHLTDATALKNGAWTEVTGIETEPDPIEEYWGAMTSDGVFQFEPKIDVNAT
jgi:hypothetical protein